MARGKLFRSVRQKVWLSVGVALVGFAAAVAISLLANQRFATHFIELRDFDYPLARQSQSVVTLFQEQQALYEEGFLLGQEESIAAANGIGPKIMEIFETMLALKENAGYAHRAEHRGCDLLPGLYRSYFESASRLYPVLAGGADPEPFQADIRALSQQRDALLTKLEMSAGKYHQTVIDGLNALRKQAEQTSLVLVALFSALSLLTFLAVRLVASKLLLKPLSQLRNLVKQADAGALTAADYPVLPEGDEIGQVGRAFLGMLQNLQQSTVSRQYVDDILHHMGEGLIVVAADGSISTINPAAAALLGWSPNEGLGQRLPPGLFDAPKEPGATEGVWETVLHAAGGRKVPVLVSETALASAAGSGPGRILVLRDMTALKAAEERECRHLAFLNDVIEAIPQPFYVVNVADYTVALANSAVSGYREGEGMTCHALTHNSAVPCHSGEHVCPLREVVASGEPVSVEHLHDGRAVEVHAYPIFDDAGQVVQIIEYALDITVRKEAEAQLQHLARYDFLTGLPNRLLLQDRLGRALTLAQREKNPLGAMFLDLDRFKMVNDSLGHSFGDRLLMVVAERLQGCLRESDTVARFGGDEFVVVLPTISQSEDAARMARRLLDALAAPIVIDGHEVHCPASIGLVVFPEDGADAETLLKNADAAMYQAKHRGGNTFQFFSADLNSRSLSRLTMENRLRNALRREEFILHYQPQFNLHTGRLCGIEALLRWRPEGEDVVEPGRFISLLEETGLIVAVGDWVLSTACRQARDWHDMGLPPVPVSVNLSGRQMQEQGLVERVDAALRLAGLEARFLELELTESTLIHNVSENIRILNQFKTMGIKLAIDDFGTGYSSMSSLKNFPIDRLKIDRSFVQNLGRETGDEAFARAIIAMSQSLNMQIVAEGVETWPQLQFLKQNGCHEGQGYFFSKPVSARAFATLARNTWAFENLIATGGPAAGR